MFRLSKKEEGYIEGFIGQKDLRIPPTIGTPVEGKKDRLKSVSIVGVYEVIEYPEVFYTGVLNYEGSTRGKLKACRDALIAWGHSCVSTVPPKFGDVLVLLREFVGASSDTPEGFIEASDRLLDPAHHKNHNQ